jgi:hypothetical protein
VSILIFIGSAIIILWGIAHLIPTGAIVRGFGEISADNKKILTMEIIAEGLTLIFVGLVPLLAGIMLGPREKTAQLIFFSFAGMLVVMAILTALTGARTPIIWYKLCPAVKTLTALLFVLGSVL